jgi:GNAT superfamily N-acetyltransferase
MSAETTSTVAGYRIALGGLPTFDEIAVLRSAAGWDTDTASRWEEVLASALAVATARDRDDTLVGMGVLSGSVRHAVLCDLDVHPQHRRRGIGTALVELRLVEARRLGCRYLYVALSDDNPFAARYRTAGLVAPAFTGELRPGPR